MCVDCTVQGLCGSLNRTIGVPKSCQEILTALLWDPAQSTTALLRDHYCTVCIVIDQFGVLGQPHLCIFCVWAALKFMPFYSYTSVFFIFYFLRTSSAREGGERCQSFLFLFPPAQQTTSGIGHRVKYSSFFRVATNALNVRNI